MFRMRGERVEYLVITFARMNEKGSSIVRKCANVSHVGA
jgi:hypothetical protein